MSQKSFLKLKYESWFTIVSIHPYISADSTDSTDDSYLPKKVERKVTNNSNQCRQMYLSHILCIRI